MTFPLFPRSRRHPSTPLGLLWYLPPLPPREIPSQIEPFSPRNALLCRISQVMALWSSLPSVSPWLFTSLFFFLVGLTLSTPISDVSLTPKNLPLPSPRIFSVSFLGIASLVLSSQIRRIAPFQTNPWESFTFEEYFFLRVVFPKIGEIVHPPPPDPQTGFFSP